MNSTLNKSNSQKLSSSSYLNDSKYNSTLLEKSKEQKTIYHLKIILLGDVSVGKTAILNRYIDGKFDNNYSCTINVQTKTKEISLNQEISAEMTIWDTCGEEKFRVTDVFSKLFVSNDVGRRLGPCICTGCSKVIDNIPVFRLFNDFICLRDHCSNMHKNDKGFGYIPKGSIVNLKYDEDLYKIGTMGQGSGKRHYLVNLK